MVSLGNQMSSLTLLHCHDCYGFMSPTSEYKSNGTVAQDILYRKDIRHHYVWTWGSEQFSLSQRGYYLSGLSQLGVLHTKYNSCCKAHEHILIILESQYMYLIKYHYSSVDYQINLCFLDYCILIIKAVWVFIIFRHCYTIFLLFWCKQWFSWNSVPSCHCYILMMINVSNIYFYQALHYITRSGRLRLAIYLTIKKSAILIAVTLFMNWTAETAIIWQS